MVISQNAGQFGDIDFDILILRTLVIDGEVFIRVDKNAKNPYGISFELLDTLQIDLTNIKNLGSNMLSRKTPAVPEISTITGNS